MDNEKKWKLKSGRCVEDVLFQLGKSCNFHHEIKEICDENIKDPPPLNSELIDFTKTTDIREELNKPHKNLGKEYDINKHYQYDYVKSTVTDWVRLLEQTPNPLTLDLPEQWYRTNVWRSIDNAFIDIPYVLVVGGERSGIATSDCENRNRSLANITPTQRKIIGKKGDAFIRSIGSRQVDWAASEAGCHWEGPNGTKLIKEGGFSLPRQLKDIFWNLADKVNFNEEKMKKIDVIGFIHAGALMLKVNLDNPKGYICRYVRNSPLEVYAEVEKFPMTLDVIIEILYAKNKILHTMEVVNRTNIQEAYNRWECLGKQKRRNDSIDFPQCHPLPKKKHVNTNQIDNNN
nr:1893_t:CDS:2 [Entrophospora candida]